MGNIHGDTVDPSNLNRLIGATEEDVGFPKAGVAKRRFKAAAEDLAWVPA
jgi:molybdopterin/thiamine biosynthesis adenylyltransferase